MIFTFIITILWETLYVLQGLLIFILESNQTCAYPCSKMINVVNCKRLILVLKLYSFVLLSDVSPSNLIQIRKLDKTVQSVLFTANLTYLTLHHI